MPGGAGGKRGRHASAVPWSGHELRYALRTYLGCNESYGSGTLQVGGCRMSWCKTLLIAAGTSDLNRPEGVSAQMPMGVGGASRPRLVDSW